jgi:hypothetical protein
MLEDKNDNLLQADGNVNVETNAETGSNTEVDNTETDSIINFVEVDKTAEHEETVAVEPLMDQQIGESAIEIEETIAFPEAELKEETFEIQLNKDSEIEAIAELMPDETEAVVQEAVAEKEEELEPLATNTHSDLPTVDYETLSMEDLVSELEKLVVEEKIILVKDAVEQIKTTFLGKYNHFIEEKKIEFYNENPDTIEDFHYNFPLKSTFDKLYNGFREKKNIHFKGLESNLKSNLENRLAIVEEIKNLISQQDNIKDALKHFNDLRERWKNAGAIPKDKYNHVWNNYHFHVENFYDYLHLDREARDIDFKHNLDLKLKIIARVEELVEDVDTNKAFRELQDLHKIWKEDIGPVSKEHREEIWDKFSALTKKMHDKRDILFDEMRGRENENLLRKNEVIAQIQAFSTEKMTAHNSWQNHVEKVEALRNEFFALGKVPTEVNEITWTNFKNAVRDFNVLKNSFYKDIKKDQNDNLERKNALVAKAIELQESEDFAATTPIMKQIQEEWKTIGHVPRKFSDKVWGEFKTACNHYFEKIKSQRKEENKEEEEAFESKKAYLESMKDFEMTGNHKTDLDAIKLHIENWKTIGKVPFSKKHIDGKFNKLLDGLFEKLSLSKKDTDMMRFSNRIENLSDSNDTRKLDNEKIFLMRKIEEVRNEIFQLENNIQFFTNTKNAKKENSIVLEVRKNIAIHKESLEVWKEKLKEIKKINQE